MIYEFADLCLDTGRRQLSRGDEPLKLTKLSFSVLEALVEAAPNLLTHDKLIVMVWGPGRVISPENLSQRITMLRQSLGELSQSPVYIETVYGQGFRLIPGVTSSRSKSDTSSDPAQSSATEAADKQNRGIRVAFALLLLGLVGWAGYMFYPSYTKTTIATGESSRIAPITIAVLPFVNTSNDAEQEYFVDGLTEEILNSLVKIEGLLVTGRTSSFAFKNRNIDLRQIAKELDVDFLMEGSARKSGDKIRVTAQLIDAASGAHVISSVFDRNLVDVFAVQNEISRQVAAELKILLVHKDDQYNTALARLDSIGIEQLFTARAQIAEYSRAPVKQALNTLNELNSRYPETPEIMGLIARGHMIYGSTGSLRQLEVPLNYVQLSHATLALEPTNLDALYTLAVTADDFPAHRIQAIQYYQNMIRFHPGRGESYSRMLNYLYYVYTPCDEIKSFVDSAPMGVFSADLLAEENENYDACTNQPWKSRFSDDYYLSLVRAVEENPNQRFLSLLYVHQLRMGAWAAAKGSELHIDYAAGGWWVSYAAGYKYLFSQPSDQPVESFIEYFVRANYGSYDRAAFFLLHQGAVEEDLDATVRFLRGLPEFPVEVATQKSAMALMVMQYRAGQVEASMQTAQSLSYAMNHYLLDSPGSYRYFNLAKNHLIAAFYANDFELAQQILSTGFADSHPYWQDDIAVIQIALAPWTQHPVAAEYMDRIEMDRQRARDKFGLQ